MNILELKRKLLPMSGPQMSMGGGGGGSSGNGTQTTISELPEWARGYAKSALEQGAAITDRKYQGYGRERNAGFSPMQLQAQEGAANMETNAGTGAGIGIASQAAKQALGTNYQGGGYGNQFQAPQDYQSGRFRADRVGTQSFAQPGAAEDYMSPYMQNVVNTQQREAQRASDIQGQQNAAAAVGKGAFGGSRSALVEAERQRNLATQKGDIQATGSQAAYQQAQQQFNADQARRLQAQQANQQYGLQAQQLGEQSRQFGAGQGLSSAQTAAQYGQAANQLNEQANQYGAGLGLQGLQTALTGANTMGTLGGQQFQQGMDINKLQNAYGGQQQALRQQGLDQAYQDYQNQQNYDYKQLGFMSDLIRGMPLGQQTATQMYSPNPSTAQNVAALGAGAYGLSKFMAEGGMAYADGGSVDSPDNVAAIVHTLSDQDLQKAMQAAQARGDMDQLEAIQNELAMRASLKNGIAGGVTDEMVQKMAGGGGVLAFDGEEGSYVPEGTADYAGVADPSLRRLFMQRDKALSEFKASPAMTRKERAELEQESFERRQKFAGEDPYSPMAEKFKKFEEDRAKNLEEGKGLAALQAIPAILQGGNAMRGIGAGVGALGGNLAQLAKSDAAEKRALAGMDFNLKDAQRKERMGLTKEAMADAIDEQKNRIATDKLRLEALKAGTKSVSDAGRAFRTTGGGGAGKTPKIAEQNYLNILEDLRATSKPNEGESPKAFEARLAREASKVAVAESKTSDFGPGRAGAAADALAVKLKAAETTALEKLSRTPDYREATPSMKQAMEEKAKAAVAQRISFTDDAGGNSGDNMAPPPPPGFKRKP